MTAVALANARVPILVVCRRLGLDVPEIAAGSVKVYCPFGELYHADGGREAAFRIYPQTNSAFCFAGCGYFSVVGLVAQVRGTELDSAAEELLDDFGIPRTRAWDDVVAVREPEISHAQLAEAFKTFCHREVPDFARRQFTDLAAVVGRCLDLLTLVGDSETAYTWLQSSKRVIRLHEEGLR